MAGGGDKALRARSLEGTPVSHGEAAEMNLANPQELIATRARKAALARAIERNRTEKWQLRLWSRFIKTRDAFRCLCCGSGNRIQAHHIMRRALYPPGALDPGNGITLCPECHWRVHAHFNGKPDLSLPIGAEQGDDQDEWSYLFGLLVDDAGLRRVPEDEFYHLGDHVIAFSEACQGYEDLCESVRRGGMSRIRFAHEIWGVMPEGFYAQLACQVGIELLA